MRMQKKVLVTAALALLVVGCSSIPKWVNMQGAAFGDNGISALYGVGMARTGPNLAATRAKAEARGRAELGKQIETYSSTFIKDFMEEHKDYMADDASAGSTEFFSSVGKNISEATLTGSMVVDTYRGDDGYWYSLVKLPLDNKFLASFKSRVAAQLREKQGLILKGKTDEMLGELDKELAKKSKRQGM